MFSWKYGHCVQQTLLRLTRHHGRAAGSACQGRLSRIESQLSVRIFSVVALQTGRLKQGLDFGSEVDRPCLLRDKWSKACQQEGKSNESLGKGHGKAHKAVLREGSGFGGFTRNTNLVDNLFTDVGQSVGATLMAVGKGS